MAAILSPTSGCAGPGTFAWTNPIAPGGCGSPPIINSPTSCVTTVSNLACAGDYTFLLCKTATGCSPSCDAVVIHNYLYPAGNTVNAGPDQLVLPTLGIKVATMKAYAIASPNSGLWTKISGPGTVVFASTTNPATTATVTVAGTYVYRWTLVQQAGSPCPPLFDDVTITYA